MSELIIYPEPPNKYGGYVSLGYLSSDIYLQHIDRYEILLNGEDIPMRVI